MNFPSKEHQTVTDTVNKVLTTTLTTLETVVCTHLPESMVPDADKLKRQRRLKESPVPVVWWKKRSESTLIQINTFG